jgi:hypothetical protein
VKHCGTTVIADVFQIKHKDKISETLWYHCDCWCFSDKTLGQDQ